MNADFRALSFEEVLSMLQKPQPTLVLFHERPDADAVGSAFATSIWLRAMGSPAICVCADEVGKRLEFLTEGLQKSVLPSVVPRCFDNARVITVDTASPAQLGPLYEMFKERIVLMIDHHGKGTPYADHYVVPTAAAAAEIIYDLISASGVDVPPRVSQLLYAGISGDTGCFRYSNTTRGTHLRAAELVENGIDAAEINRRLFDSKTYKQLQVEHAGFERIHFYGEGKIALLTFPHALMEQLGAAREDTETLIDVARSIHGVEVAAAIKEPEGNGVFRVSMRSNVDFDVAAVCTKFGGGGHARAAGAAIEAESIEEAEKKLLSAILESNPT